MKNYLSIFLMVLLPLQFSWAATVGYCQHETSVTSKHTGHHTQDQSSDNQQESSKNAPYSACMDHDCATCHMVCAIAPVNDLGMITAKVSDNPPPHFQGFASHLSKERPERPQWPMLA